jgi:hypothetical protein
MPKKFSTIQQGGNAVFQAKAEVQGSGTLTHVEVSAFIGGKKAMDAFHLVPIEDWKVLQPGSRKKIIYTFMGVGGDFDGDENLRTLVKKNADAVIRAVNEVVGK